MRKPWWVGAGFAGALACFLACGSSSDGDSAAKPCVPGQSIACAGSGGCSGSQICAADGNSYGACDCGSGGSDAGSGSDSGSNGDASTSDSGTFTPTSLSNLALWAEASDGQPDAGASLRLPDRAGYGQFFDIMSGSPFIVASSTIASGPAVRFSNSGSDQMRAPLGRFSSDDYIAEIVVDTSATSESSVFGIGGDNAGGGFTLVAGNGTARFIYPTAGASVPCSLGSPHVLGVRSSGGYVRLRIDGNVTTTGAQTTTTGTNTHMILGTLEMDIAEVILVTTPSADDITNLEAYLKSKYGL